MIDTNYYGPYIAQKGPGKTLPKPMKIAADGSLALGFRVYILRPYSLSINPKILGPN